MSLFHEIPRDRTCEDAGIEAHWCVCLQWSDVPIQDRIVQSIAHGFVDAMNNETAAYRDICAENRLIKIVKAFKYLPDLSLLKFRGSLDSHGDQPDLSGDGKAQIEFYQVEFWTSPGDAHYEGTASWDKTAEKASIDLSVLSQVNEYGDKAHCIERKNYYLMMWCVCYDRI